MTYHSAVQSKCAIHLVRPKTECVLWYAYLHKSILQAWHPGMQ